MLLTTKATLILLVISASLHAAPVNGLYFGLDNMRGFAEVYWWFLPDGRVLRDTLPTGLTADKFDAACRQHSGLCGNYTLSGDRLTLQYKTGNSEIWSYKPLNGGIQLNYLILTPVEKCPAGAKLDGRWDRASANVHSSPGSNTTVTYPTFYAFRLDGTFTSVNATGIGTYTVDNNVLTLIRNGASEQHMIFPVAGGSLNIDGMVYQKR